MKKQLIAAYILSDRDLGQQSATLLMAIASMKLDLDVPEQFAMNYANLTVPRKSGEMVDDFLEQYIRSIDGGKYLNPNYSQTRIEDNSIAGNSICICFITDADGAGSITGEILARGARWRKLGRPDEELQTYSFGISVSGKNPLVIKAYCTVALQFGSRYSSKAAGFVAEVSNNNPDDLEAFELLIRHLYRAYTTGDDMKNLIDSGKPKEILKGLISAYNGKGGANAEISAAENALSAKSKFSFFGGKGK